MGLNWPADKAKKEIEELNPLSIHMSIVYTVSAKQLDESKEPGVIDMKKTFFASPAYLCQPFLTNGKKEADEANFYNDKL